ncbi:MAG: signal recognition particle-docking protein FtsY [Rickettsiales bacterium]
MAFFTSFSPQEKPEDKQQGWLARLTSGLSKTSTQLGGGITAIFTKRKLDEEALEELEELLIMADIGPKLAAQIVADFSSERFGKEVDEAEVKSSLASQIALLLEPVAKPLDISRHQPFIVLVVGVNGNGKTTTIGKLALQFKQQGKNVMLAAADTFRAAAVEQLRIWSERARVPIVTAPEGSDPASVAFQATERAKAKKTDVLFIDTAGRLHNKQNLMEELLKITRVIKKIDATAPHAVIQVLDGTTGQNALAQVKAFKELIDVTGLVVTKLDGTAKGGAVIALADHFKLPIHAIGVGEGIEDLQAFRAQDFARSLVG